MQHKINLGGVEIPFKLNLNTLSKFKERTGKDLLSWFGEEFNQNGEVDLLTFGELIYACYWAGCIGSKVDATHTKESLLDLVDIFDPEALQPVTDAIVSALPKGKKKESELKAVS